MVFYSITYQKNLDGYWGSKEDNGNFNGMIGMIQRGEVECAVTSFTLKKSRAEVADFVTPVGYLEY